MKKNVSKIALLLLFVLPLGFTACDKEPEVEPADKTALVAKIAEAENILDEAVIGKLAGEYTQAVVDELQTAIDAAKLINEDEEATQTQVDATVANLQLAIEDFQASANVEISPEFLVAYWKLAGNGDDASENDHNGTLKAGPTDKFPDGGTEPQPATDRYGEAGQALHFAHGSNVQVPFSDDLNPDEMTISVWLNADSLSVSRTQYIMSLNIWNTWKFELPNHGKPFVTRKLSDDVYLNFDSNPVALEPQTWYQVITTIDSEKCHFYIDGVHVVAWDIPSTAKPVTADPSVDLVIGTFLPNDEEWTLDSWFTSFHGILDDIRIYSKALTAAEVEALYNMEKTE
jgi:hypothetical protein